MKMPRRFTSRWGKGVLLAGETCEYPAPWKRQHVFLEDPVLLHRREQYIRAVVAGKEPFDGLGYEHYLKNLTREYGISSVVEFHGFVRDPYSLLASWDVAVHASIEPEPLGRVVIEAMWVGTPVVATNGGDGAEFVEHGRTGLLVPMGDAGAMADAIETVLTDGELRESLAEAGRDRAREMFDPRKHAREVMGVYVGMLHHTETTL